MILLRLMHVFDFKQSSNNITIYLLMHALSQLFVIIDYAADYNFKYIHVDY